MKKITLYLFCTLVLGELQAQDENRLSTQLSDFRLSVVQHSTNFDSQNFTGSPFLEAEWQNAIIEFTDGKQYHYPAKYNIYSDQFWIKNEDDNIKSLNISEQVRHLTLGEHRFEYITYIFNNKPKIGLAEVLCENRLYKIYTCKFIKGQNAGGYQEAVKDSYVTKTILYYKIENQIAQELPLNKNDLFSTFDNKSSEMEEYFKTQKMKTKNESDIIKLFTYFDSL